MNNKNAFLIISGPTGVGKTDFVNLLAEKMPSEIVNIDVGQFYTPLTIGTAKPEWRNQKIPHHLFDIINEAKNFTVFDYRKLVEEKLLEIWKKNKLPILVGGSGFYIQSLLFPPQKQQKIENKNNIEKNLWQVLYKIDPERAIKIEKNDFYRIERALQIYKSTGKKPSEFLPKYQPLGNYIFIILNRERDDLYKRINERVIEMFSQGWIEEVKKLDDEWHLFLKEKKLIGYDDILKYLNSENCDENLLIETIRQKTRNYAKRQITFFKMLTKKIIKAESQKHQKSSEIDWFDLSKKTPQFYTEEIVKKFKK